MMYPNIIFINVVGLFFQNNSIMSALKFSCELSLALDRNFQHIHCTILQMIILKDCMNTRAAKRHSVVHIAVSHRVDGNRKRQYYRRTKIKNR